MTGGGYYDRAGTPISSSAWATLHRDDEYRVVAAETLPNGLYVSTVWLGINHNFGSGSPLIFETMVFLTGSDLTELDVRRYPTEAAAAAGHRELAERWTTTTVDTVGLP